MLWKVFLFTKKSVLFELYDFLLSISIRKKKSICLLSINIAYYRYLKTSVLVCLDYWNKTPQSWWLKNKFIFHSFTYWKAKDQGMSTFSLLRASSSKTPIPWVLRWWTGEGIPPDSCASHQCRERCDGAAAAAFILPLLSVPLSSEPSLSHPFSSPGQFWSAPQVLLGLIAIEDRVPQRLLKLHVFTLLCSKPR